MVCITNKSADIQKVRFQFPEFVLLQSPVSKAEFEPDLEGRKMVGALHLIQIREQQEHAEGG